MPNIINYQTEGVPAVPTPGSLWPAPASRALARLQRSTLVQLATVQARTVVRSAVVQSEAIVATVKLQEMDRLAREAMSGQAMLRRWSDTLCQGDPFLADELKFFTDTARLAKGEIIADTMVSYCREGGRS